MTSPYWQSEMIDFLGYILGIITVFVIGAMQWYGAKIEGYRARYADYQLKSDLQKMFRKLKIDNLEKGFNK